MYDYDLVCKANKIDRYCPVVEDISFDDDMLYEAVEQLNTK